MWELVINMIEQSEKEENYDLIGYAKELIEELSKTINCPSNWRIIAEKLTKIYDETTWAYEELELWNYID